MDETKCFISGTAIYLPERVVANDELSDTLGIEFGYDAIYRNYDHVDALG